MKFLNTLLLSTLLISGCSNLPSQVTVQDPQIVSTKNSFTWVGLQVGMKNNKSPIIDREQVVVVFNIYPLSPAMKATVNKNDIIISIDGEKLKDHNDFIERIKKSIPNQEIRLKVFRDGGFIDLIIMLQAYDMETYVNRVIEYVKETRNDDFAHLILGDYFALKKDLQKAIEHFKTATIVNPQNSTAYAALAGIYGFELQKYEEGIKYFKKAIAISPKFSNYHFDLGLFYSILKQHDNAIEEYKVTINLSPNDSEAYNYLGEEYEELKNYQQAMKSFRAAVKNKPAYYKARLNIAKLHRLLGDSKQAVLELKELIKLSSKTIKLNKVQEANLLVELGSNYYVLSEYTNAIPILIKAVEIADKLGDRSKYLHLVAIRNLGNAYYAVENYDKALPVYKQGESISKGLYGKSNLGHVYALRRLGETSYAMKNYSEANFYFTAAVKIHKIQDHINSAKYLALITWLGHVNYASANYLEAESYYLEAIQIHKNQKDIHSASYVDLLNNLGNAKYAGSDYQGGESTYRSAMKILVENNQENNSGMTASLMGIANSLTAQNKYSDAEKFLLKAIMLKKTNNGQDPRYATMLSSLASLYYGMGAQHKAEDILLEVIALQVTNPFINKGDSYSSKNLLGLIYFERLEYDRAMKYFQSAREAANKFYGIEDGHPESANILNNIGRVHFAQGDYDKALNFGEKALQAIPNNEKHYLDTFARIKMGMAEIYRMKKKFDKSKELFSESLNVMSDIYEKGNIVMASNLIGAARLDADLGNYKKAWKKMRRAVNITETDIDLKYEYTSGNEKIAYFRTLDSDFYVSLLMALAGDEEVLEEAYGVFLRLKNNVLYSSMDQKINTTEAKDLQKIISSKREELSHLSYSKSSKVNPKFIESEIDELERKISRINSRERIGNISVNLSTVSKNMPESSTLIDFLKVSLNTFGGERITPPGHFITLKEKEDFNPHHYIAIVYSKNEGKLSLLDLGLADEIDKSIIEFRGAIQALDSSKKIKVLGNILFKAIFHPETKLIKTDTNIFISPDSKLALLPFETLVDDNGNYLVDKYKFTYLNSGRDFMGFNKPSINSGIVTLFGNPDFNFQVGEPSTETCQDKQQEPNRCPESSGFSFSSLPGTEREVNQIKEVLTNENVETFKSQFASEATLKKIESPKILHIATHGFFQKNITIDGDNQKTRAMLTVSDATKPSDISINGEEINNPLLASGIALSGANRIQRGIDIDDKTDDGIVSAMEIKGLSLKGTSLVVLSACNTGIGDVERAQGVFGLRRAFQIAGARSLLMSLWKVPDSETADLMRRFYMNLYDGKSKVDSLNMSIKDTMREIKKIRGTDHPFYWGGFILIGNPENN